MPTYDYRCEKCGKEFEEFLPMARRTEPTEIPCGEHVHGAAPVCGGKINQAWGSTPPGFAYDNISSPGHTKKPPSWMTDKLKEIKKNQPKATMSWHH